MSLMSDYQQPDFYRFNQDSLILVRWVCSFESHPQSILDLGAGCGVMGLELARSYRPKHLVLLELQSDFEPYLRKNICEFAPSETHCEVIIDSFSAFRSLVKFDLIVCNPPYYHPAKGQASKDERRGKARSFIVDDWSVLFERIKSALAPQGAAFVVLKDDSTTIDSLLPPGLRCERDLSDGLQLLRLTLTA